MMEWLNADTNRRYVITHSAMARQQLQQQYPDLAHRIMDWDQYQERSKGGHLAGAHSLYSIDNADMILQKLMAHNHPVDFISVTEYPDESEI